MTIEERNLSKYPMDISEFIIPHNCEKENNAKNFENYLFVN